MIERSVNFEQRLYGNLRLMEVQTMTLYDGDFWADGMHVVTEKERITDKITRPGVTWSDSMAAVGALAACRPKGWIGNE